MGLGDYRRSSSALDLSVTTRSNFHRLNRLPQMQLITDSNSSSRKLAIAFYNKLVFFDSAGSQKARWKTPALGSLFEWSEELFFEEEGLQQLCHSTFFWETLSCFWAGNPCKLQETHGLGIAIIFTQT
jgi:hypothetical protein